MWTQPHQQQATTLLPCQHRWVNRHTTSIGIKITKVGRGNSGTKTNNATKDMIRDNRASVTNSRTNSASTNNVICAPSVDKSTAKKVRVVLLIKGDLCLGCGKQNHWFSVCRNRLAKLSRQQQQQYQPQNAQPQNPNYQYRSYPQWSYPQQTHNTPAPHPSNNQYSA